MPPVRPVDLWIPLAACPAPAGPDPGVPIMPVDSRTC